MLPFMGSQRVGHNGATELKSLTMDRRTESAQVLHSRPPGINPGSPVLALPLAGAWTPRI